MREFTTTYCAIIMLSSCIRLWQWYMQATPRGEFIEAHDHTHGLIDIHEHHILGARSHAGGAMPSRSRMKNEPACGCAWDEPCWYCSGRSTYFHAAQLDCVVFNYIDAVHRTVDHEHAHAHHTVAGEGSGPDYRWRRLRHKAAPCLASLGHGGHPGPAVGAVMRMRRTGKSIPFNGLLSHRTYELPGTVGGSSLPDSSSVTNLSPSMPVRSSRNSRVRHCSRGSGPWSRCVQQATVAGDHAEGLGRSRSRAG